MLEQEGIQLAIASMGSIKPLDQTFLKECISEGYSNWISLEEHHQTGGLGSSLLEWLSEQKVNTIKLRRMGIADKFVHELGSQEYVRKAQRIDATAIASLVKSL